MNRVLTGWILTVVSMIGLGAMTSSYGSYASSKEVEGTISAIAADGSTVTITTKAGAVVTVNVNASTKVTLNHQTSTVAALAVGNHAESHYDGTTLVAKNIEASNGSHKSEVEGTITSVATDGSSVTITSRKGTAVTLGVSASTKISRNHKTVPATALQTGDKVEASYDASTLTAARIEARGK